MLQFTYPWLLVLLPFPWLVSKLLPPYPELITTVRVPFLSRMAALSGHQPGNTASPIPTPRIQLLMHLLVWMLLLTGLAQPQWLEDPIHKDIPMRDLLVAVDLSGSMETRDFTAINEDPVDRLTAVKEVLDEFLARRINDRIGLIVFGSAPFVQVPFTEDNDVVRQLLNELSVRMAGPRTMLGDAIGLGITLFDRSEVEERIMILLTDGNDTGSLIPPNRAAEIARDKDVVLYTIGVGDPSAAGEGPLDETVLKRMAEITGGQYFHAADRIELEHIYTELDKLTPKKVETISHRPKQELFYWPLGTALLITLLYHGLAALFGEIRSWFRRRKRFLPKEGNPA